MGVGTATQSATATSTTAARSVPVGETLVRLLGESRAAIVTELRLRSEQSISQLADLLGVSEVATRRHVAVLEEDDLVMARTVKQPRGRPAARYQLTEQAHRLFPQRYDELATEVLDFLRDEHGREGLVAFLRWRLDKETAALKDAVTAEELHDRLEQLASKLSDAGFIAQVETTDEGFRLVQHHCTIADVAREHPEVCSYEAAAFSQVLGQDVSLSRRQTLASGAPACVCTVAATSSARTARAATE